MDYDYLPKIDVISAFKWTGTLPGDVPAWFAALQIPGTIAYDAGIPTIDIVQNLSDRITGVVLDPIRVPINYWLIKHDDDTLTMLSDSDFLAKYELVP